MPIAICTAVSMTPPRPRSRRCPASRLVQKYNDTDDEHFRTRAILVKEQRAEEVKHHLMVLWADFFTKEQFLEQFPNLHQLFWDGVHGAGDVKKSTDVATCEKLFPETIDKISDISLGRPRRPRAWGSTSLK